MLFHVYGSEAIPQWIAMLGVLAALILLNEFARRTKAGGIIMFFVIPAVLTVYFIAIAVGAGMGAQWALENQTHVYMNGWFQVPLREVVCITGRLYRIHDDQIRVGNREDALV